MTPAGRATGTGWTQVVGQFNEIVIETDYPDLTAYERETAASMSDPGGDEAALPVRGDHWWPTGVTTSFMTTEKAAG